MGDLTAAAKIGRSPPVQVARLLASSERRALARARKNAVALTEREQELTRLAHALRAVHEWQRALRREERSELDLARLEQVRERLAQLADDEQAMLGARAELAARVAAAARELAASIRALRAARRTTRKVPSSGRA